MVFTSSFRGHPFYRYSVRSLTSRADLGEVRRIFSGECAQRHVNFRQFETTGALHGLIVA